MSDPLFEAIVAAPDDDAPRLVWADREGGDRAELVVLQCRLAQRDVPRAERHRLLRRQRDLLTLNRVRWTRDLRLPEGTVPDFARGFVEQIGIRTDAFIGDAHELAARLPLLRSVFLRPVSVADGRLSPADARAALAMKLSSAFAAFPRLRSLTGSPSWERGMGDDFAELVARVPSLRELTELEVATQPSDEGIAYLARMPKLARLALPDHRLGSAWTPLDLIPTLRRLAIGRGPVALPPPSIAARLRELDVGEKLEPHEVHALLADTPNLEVLALHAPLDDADLSHIARRPFAPRLRALSLRGSRLTAASIATLLSFPQLETLWVIDQAPILPRSSLEDVIPDVHLP